MYIFIVHKSLHDFDVFNQWHLSTSRISQLKQIFVPKFASVILYRLYNDSNQSSDLRVSNKTPTDVQFMKRAKSLGRNTQYTTRLVMTLGTLSKRRAVTTSFFPKMCLLYCCATEKKKKARLFKDGLIFKR